MTASALAPRVGAFGIPPPTPVLVAIAVAGCAAAVCTVAPTLASENVPDPIVRAVLIDWITLPYILSGVVAWSRRPDSRFGPLMVIAGFAMFLSTLQWSSVPVALTAGTLVDFLPVAIFLHLFLAYPSGRLERSFDRALVVAAYVAALGVRVVVMSIGDFFGPGNLLQLWSEPRAAEAVQRGQLIAMSAFALAGVGVLVARRRAAGRPLRRSLALLVDSFALALVTIAVLFLSHAFDGPFIEPIRWTSFGLIGLAPVAFLAGLLDARLARSSVGDLFVALRADLAPADLQDALSRALRDPSLTLAYWLPDFASWADVDGRALALPREDATSATTLIDRDGEAVAALVHDPALRDEPELLDAVGAAAGIALENGRLHVELRARLEELRGSRSRVIEAGQRERQRLERNLHDGAQQRLVSLSLDLSLLGKLVVADPDAKSRVDLARHEIALSLEELRDVARCIHPAVLTGHGLAVALESIAARAPLPVELVLHLDGRLAEPVEVAAYYVVSESLANVVKHAGASAARIELGRANGRLVVEVADDGVGGADAERGSGLRGLADRVEALGGRLRVWTPRGGGTRVEAEIPCA
jgi:signal transduction histidine kinase